jgi:hypothetical protein
VAVELDRAGGITSQHGYLEAEKNNSSCVRDRIVFIRDSVCFLKNCFMVKSKIL